VPTLSDLYTPVRTGQTNGVYNDLLDCIRHGSIDNSTKLDYCGIQPDKLSGGSTNLKLEESKQHSLRLVLEPPRMISASVDHWRIDKRDVITYAEGAFFENPVFYSAFITRGPPGPALGGIPGPITSIDVCPRNTATLPTSGINGGF
jgi:iron complex outermembrane receptor protein